MPYGTNVAHLVPHGQLRREVMGEDQGLREDPHPSDEEMATLEAWVDGGMRAGAFGLATGLIYEPGARAGTLELVALSRVVGRHGGLYASHTRHEGPDPVRMFASYAEAITIGEQAGVPVHISHIKLQGKATHGRTAEVIGLVEAARARGVAVTADQYPYAASSTTLAVLAPPEMREGSRVHPRHCEAGPARHALVAAIERSLETSVAPEDVTISVYPWRWWWQGRSLADVAAGKDVAPAELAADIACGRPGAGIFHSQDEADVRAFMARDWVATASDGTAMVDFIGRFVHPRAYGTFPRKLRRYALDRPVVELAFALRSMTELPASILGLEDRGRLEPGAFADVVVLDPATLRDVATFDRSGRHSEGVEWLFVNGVPAIESGEPTDERAGRALRNPRRLGAGAD
jgi:N-acyl-D-aspartate/D-glutamate deacylase